MKGRKGEKVHLGWPRAKAAYGEVAEGLEVELDKRNRRTGRKRPAFRVGLHLVDEDDEPLAVLVMRPWRAVETAKMLVGLAATVDHLNECHPSGDRTRCEHPPEAMTAGEWKDLCQGALGPLADALRAGRQTAMELLGALEAIGTVALEHGMLAPEGSVGLMTDGDIDTMNARVAGVMDALSDAGRRLLPMVLALSSEEACTHLPQAAAALKLH